MLLNFTFLKLFDLTECQIVQLFHSLLLEIFDLKDDDPEAVRAHLLELASAVVELMFPAEEDAGPPAKGDAETGG